MRAIPERLRGVFTTRLYTDPRLSYLTWKSLKFYGDRQLSVLCQERDQKSKKMSEKSYVGETRFIIIIVIVIIIQEFTGRLLHYCRS